MSLDPLAPGTLALAEEFGLSRDEYDLVLEKLGRTPNVTELGIFSVMWSEHCSYKSTRVHLAKFPTTAPHVIYGPGENAGAIDIGEGLAAIFKMESHNHPSFIEPFQGAATGVGGILRDVFTMGARPVAIMNALRFGEPDHPKTRKLVDGVVSGISFYGNCVGVPTVGGETNFDARYNGNILVNVFCLGIADKTKIFTSAAKGANNPVVYVGAKTGRDGIHGATMASAEFDDDSDAQRPTVQVGDPFLEKLLIEACLELMATDAIIGIQDMGAAGLTSSSVEMASKGEAGILLDLDAVPAREEGMTPYEFMLSESQERMLMTLKPGREAEAKAIFEKWGLDAAVIGQTTDTGNLTLRWHGQIVCDIPLGPLADEAPKYERPYVQPLKAIPLTEGETKRLNDEYPGFAKSLTTLLSQPDQASKRWIWEQYDRHVMGDTLADSGGDAAIVRLYGSQRALAMTCDVTPRYVEADAYEGGKQAVAEAWRNLSVTGARPLAVTDNLNFGNPQRPEVMGQIVYAIEGLAEACRALEFPVISGNVSLYNETNGQAILPTPAIGGVGIIDNMERRATADALKPGDVLVLIGETEGHLGQSIYARDLYKLGGAAPKVDLALEKKNGDFVRALISDGTIRAAHDLSDGGLGIAAAEMALGSDVGVSLGYQGDLSDAAFLYAEDQARYLIAIPANKADTLDQRARAAGVSYLLVGEAGGREISYLGATGNRERVSLEDLRKAHESWLPAYMKVAH
ncbi:phosphoribosylformylglycinamidine synthase subunit PurL [Terricaulis silvestris]|uniref:Phosphoribosylformylglycinamidine synthase subunit PurL n=1 Tax=Terricaulis silvestris TaxID=2686094 RepID=A0A6I6MSD9_9CAUL|nr:phosphoribosylformylglycinamidine synthase subunit PurL [Terricaulis silvestris]QGZ95697.1 Phosphoribosylformylglycinamidine synthase 2 [Terricaulis silvestris]